ncbi:hypothetical protein LBMAG42_52600 [Deltaproteobacteria bacterium]|nr:hypothetical protein LBMAG42_52600 [Deltaproteobacteria bacterium]
MIWALLACAAEALDGAPASKSLDPSLIPTDPGIYRLRGEDITLLPTNTTLATGAASGEPPSQYPLVLPAAPPTLAADDLLVLVGAGAETWTVASLTPTTQVPGAPPLGEAGPWYVLDSAAAPFALALERRTPTDPPARTLAAGSLPPGRYVLRAPDAARALIFEATRP